MGRLFCHYLFLMSPALGASGRLCFMIVAFPWYLLLCYSPDNNLDKFKGTDTLSRETTQSNCFPPF